MHSYTAKHVQYHFFSFPTKLHINIMGSSMAEHTYTDVTIFSAIFCIIRKFRFFSVFLLVWELCGFQHEGRYVDTRYRFDFWCFNATFSNISAISWRPVLVVGKAGVPGENHRPSKLYHLLLRVECTLFVIYKAGRVPTLYWW
jgi:hypothetical protein